jgi:hypothetical protein
MPYLLGARELMQSKLIMFLLVCVLPEGKVSMKPKSELKWSKVVWMSS